MIFINYNGLLVNGELHLLQRSHKTVLPKDTVAILACVNALCDDFIAQNVEIA